jgi:cytochrome c oxidase subunit 2
MDVRSGWPPPVLDPAGPFAGPLTTVAWVLFGMGFAVLMVVLAVLAVAIFGPPRLRGKVQSERLVWIGGVIFPVVVLSALLVYGLATTARLSDAADEADMRVRVTGEMWWWRVAYLDADGREAIQDANEVHIPTGQPVVIELESADVIHSLWIPRLGGKTDMIPGRRNFMRIQADAPGVYAGQCAEYCGGPHALMGLVVIAHTPDDYEAWRLKQAGPAVASSLPRLL